MDKVTRGFLISGAVLAILIIIGFFGYYLWNNLIKNKSADIDPEHD